MHLPYGTSQFSVFHTQPQPKMNLSANAVAKEKKAELDLRNLSEDDLASLQRSDPFLYYSIPTVEKSKLTMKNIDHSALLASLRRLPQASQVVPRKTQVATECHATTAIEDLLAMDDETFMSHYQASRRNVADTALDSNDVGTDASK